MLYNINVEGEDIASLASPVTVNVDELNRMK